MENLEKIKAKRTIAMISHPDAGKTTLTEKFLLFGGAINQAGKVKAKDGALKTRSDFMKMERDRGISISSSAMSFDYKSSWFNLVDTPGHSDFSEDTYRALSAVDSSIMIIDGAKGVESQTKKLFEVCRLRDMPIITFCNKMDRESRELIEIIDEIQEMLAIDVTPLSWPIGSGSNFSGVYNILREEFEIFKTTPTSNKVDKVIISGLQNKEVYNHVDLEVMEKFFDEFNLATGLLPKFTRKDFLDGTLSPIFFGSALNSIGVDHLMDSICEIAPSPGNFETESRTVLATENKVSGFVFKIQANTDTKHRDRVAFLRLSSGHFRKGMKLYHSRLDKNITVSNPVMFLGQNRDTTEDAYAGDIIGIPNHGILRIGDTLSEGEKIKFKNLPSFAPEILKSVSCPDPLKSKHLDKALSQFAEEGLASVFKTLISSSWIIGVIGQLQFDVLKSRIETEYGLPIRYEQTNFITARWLIGEKKSVEEFIDKNREQIAIDNDGKDVFLPRIQWDIDRAIKDYPNIELKNVKTFSF